VGSLGALVCNQVGVVYDEQNSNREGCDNCRDNRWFSKRAFHLNQRLGKFGVPQSILARRRGALEFGWRNTGTPWISASGPKPDISLINRNVWTERLSESRHHRSSFILSQNLVRAGGRARVIRRQPEQG
jgi:hypothetical protein